MVCENTLVNADQKLTNENVFIVEATKPELLSIRLTVIHIKYGGESTMNGIVITVIVNLQLLQNDKDKKMQIDLSIKENMLEPEKYWKNELVDVLNVLIIFLMVRADIHSFITLVNMTMTIQWLTLSNYV